MQVTVNDLVCIAGEIVEQRSGAWTARVEVDDEDNAISGDATIVVGSETFAGTVVRGEVPEGRGRWIGHVVGGKGGLDLEIEAKYYFSASLRTIVSDALAAAGESLDQAGTETASLATLMSRWMRIRGKCRLALTQVAKEIGGFWRVTRGGQVVVRKAETWEAVDFDYESIDSDPSDGTLELAPDEVPGARPGVTVGGHKIGAVTTRWSGAGVRQLLSIDADDGRARGAGGIFAEAIKKASESAINYSQWYPAKVVQQDADGTVHLLPDDARVRGTGLTHVPILHGIPGLTVRVALGTYVRLFFQDGDPKRPACALWDDGSSVLAVTLQCAQGLTVVAPQIHWGPTANPTQSAVLGELLMTYIDGVTTAVKTALNAIPSSAAGSPNPGGAPAAGIFSTALGALEAAKQAALSTVIKVQ